MAHSDITQFGLDIMGRKHQAWKDSQKMPSSQKWFKGLQVAATLWDKAQQLKYSEMIDQENFDNLIEYGKKKAEIAKLNERYKETAPIMQKFKGMLAPLDDVFAQEKILGPDAWERTLADNPTFSAAHPELTRKEYKDMVRRGVISQANAEKIDNLYNERINEKLEYIRSGQTFDPTSTNAIQAEYLKLGIDPKLADSGLMSHITGSTRRRIKLRDNYIDTFRDTLVSEEALTALNDFETVKKSPSIEEAQKAVQDMTIGVVPRLTPVNIGVYHELPSSVQDYMKTSLTTWFDNNKDANGEQINNTFERYANYAFHTDAAIEAENRSFNAEIEGMERLLQSRLPDAILTGNDAALQRQFKDVIATQTQDHQTKIDHLRTLGTNARENYRELHRIYKTIEDPAMKEVFGKILKPLAGLPLRDALAVAEFVKTSNSNTVTKYTEALKGIGWDGNTANLSAAQRQVFNELDKKEQIFTPSPLPSLSRENAARVNGAFSSSLARIREENPEAAERIQELESKLNPEQALLLKHSLVHHSTEVSENNNSYSMGGRFFLGRPMTPSDVLQIGIQAAFEGEDSLILIDEEEPIFLGFGGGETFTPLIDNIQNSQYGHQWLIDQVKKQNLRTLASNIPGIEVTEDARKLVYSVERMPANTSEDIEAIVNASNDFLLEQRELKIAPKDMQNFIQQTLELPHLQGKIDLDDDTQQFIVSGEVPLREETRIPGTEVQENTEQLLPEEQQEIKEAVQQAQGTPVEITEIPTPNFNEVQDTSEWKSSDFMSKVEIVNNWTDSTGENPFFREDESRGIQYYTGMTDQSPFAEDGDSVQVSLQSRQEDDTRARRMKITFKDGTLHVEPVVSILSPTVRYQGITEPLTFDDIPESRVKDHVRWMALNLNLAQTSKTPRGIGSPTSVAANNILSKIDLEGPDVAGFGMQLKRKLLEDALKDIMKDAWEEAPPPSGLGFLNRTGGRRELDFDSFRGFHRKS